MKNTRTFLSYITILVCVFSCKEKQKTVSSDVSDVISESSTISENNCIDTVIHTDATLGKIRNEAPNMLTLSQAIDNYLLGMKAMNFEECPGPFVAAFEDHIESWSAIKEITDKYPQLRGEMHALFDQLKNGNDGERFKELLAVIWSSWEKVERAMSQY